MTLPTVIIAGDSAEIPYYSADYPASAWTLAGYLNGPSSLVLTGVAQADDSFILAITAAQSTGLKAGLYDLTLRASSGSVVTTVHTSTVDVKPNPALTGTRTVLASRMLVLIESALEGQLSDGMAAESISIAGRSLSLLSRSDLLIERNYWTRELNGLKRGPNAVNGFKTIGINVGRWT